MNLEVLPNHSTQEFIIALIRLITRRGRTSVIYSDHANTFVVPSKWIDKINNERQGKSTSLKIRQNGNLLKQSRAMGWAVREIDPISEAISI